MSAKLFGNKKQFAAEAFDDFDVQLSEALDLEVSWEDRELLLIEEPAEDTVERIKQFLAEYPRE